MAMESDWMGRIEQHTAGSIYEQMRRLAADIEAGMTNLTSAMSEVRQDGEASAATQTRSLEELRSHLEDAIASAVLKITATLDGEERRRAQADARRDDRIAELAERLEGLEAPAPAKPGEEPLAAELVQILERARGETEP